MRAPVLAVVALTVLGGIAVGEASAATKLRSARVVQVIDGDTVLIRSTTGTRTVTLRGMDAPATGACYGSQARARLRHLLPRGARVRVDASRRVLLYRGSQLVNREMLAGGYARTKNPGSSKTGRSLQAAETKAQSRGLGLWTACVAPPAPLAPAPALPPLQPHMTAAQAQAFLSGYDLRVTSSGPSGDELTDSSFCPDGRLVVMRRVTSGATTTTDQETARWQIVGVTRRLDDAADQIEFTAVVQTSTTPGFDPSLPEDQRTAHGFVVVADDGSVLIADRAAARVPASGC